MDDLVGPSGQVTSLHLRLLGRLLLTALLGTDVDGQGRLHRRVLELISHTGVRK